MAVLTSPLIETRRRRWSRARWPVAGLAAALLFVGTAQASAAVSAGNQWPTTVVGGQATASGAVWEVQANGTVYVDVRADFHGGAYSTALAQPITGIAVMADAGGYWLVAADGGIFTYGNAHFYGSMAATHLNQPIVGIAPTRDGHGYWLAAADGGIFTFGDAHFFGSLAGSHLDQPIIGISATRSGKGYRLVARDGGVFTFGDATYRGSLGGSGVTDVLGLAQSPSGNGYWILRKTGGKYSTCTSPAIPCYHPGYVGGPSVANFGDARGLGSPNFSFFPPGSPAPSADIDFVHNPAVAIVGNPAAQGYLILRANNTHVGFAGAIPNPH